MEILPLTPLDLSYQNESKITNDQFDSFLKSPISIDDPKPLSKPQIKTKTIQSARTPPKIPVKCITHNCDKAIAMHEKASKRSHAYFEKERQQKQKILTENLSRDEYFERWRFNRERDEHTRQHSKIKPLSPAQMRDSQITEAVALSRKGFPF